MVPTRAVFASLLMGTALLAQSPSSSSDQPHAWRRAEPADEQQQQIAAAEAPDPPLADQGAPNQAPPPPPPPFTSNPSFAQAAPAPRMPANTPLPQDAAPARLTIRPGTFLTVRVNQFLSSDKSHQGDTFFAVLAEPLIVDGVVVARRGQTVMGRVSEAQKAGRVEGTSRLGLELTNITLVDGQQMPIQSQMIAREGGTSNGRDAAAIGTTTALGAAIGAGADYGRGAAIGAGAGAAAGIVGVLLTRGHATQVYPETPLTFRIQASVAIATDRAPQAFRYAESNDYGHDGYAQAAPRRVQAVPVAPYYASPYYYDPYYSYWGPSYLSFSFGRPYYGYGYGFGYGGGYRGSYGGGFRAYGGGGMRRGGRR